MEALGSLQTMNIPEDLSGLSWEFHRVYLDRNFRIRSVAIKFMPQFLIPYETNGGAQCYLDMKKADRN